MIKVLPLKGYPGYRALCSYSALVWGMKMVPQFFTLNVAQFEEDYLKSLPLDQQFDHFKRGAEIVKLTEEESNDFIAVCADPNGVRYSRENVNNLDPIQFRDLLATVAFEIYKIKIDSITAEQKKNLKTTP